jgi:hypothetical protein
VDVNWRHLPPPSPALLLPGLALILAGLVGGGLEAAGFSIPLLQVPWIRLGVAALGLLAVGLSFLSQAAPTSTPKREAASSHRVTAVESHKFWDLRKGAAPAELSDQRIPNDAVLMTDVRILDIGAGEDVEAPFVYSSKHSVRGASRTYRSAHWEHFEGDNRAGRSVVPSSILRCYSRILDSVAIGSH